MVMQQQRQIQQRSSFPFYPSNSSRKSPLFLATSNNRKTNRNGRILNSSSSSTSQRTPHQRPLPHHHHQHNHHNSTTWRTHDQNSNGVGYCDGNIPTMPTNSLTSSPLPVSISSVADNDKVFNLTAATKDPNYRQALHIEQQQQQQQRQWLEHQASGTPNNHLIDPTTFFQSLSPNSLRLVSNSLVRFSEMQQQPVCEDSRWPVSNRNAPILLASPVSSADRCGYGFAFMRSLPPDYNASDNTTTVPTNFLSSSAGTAGTSPGAALISPNNVLLPPGIRYETVPFSQCSTNNFSPFISQPNNHHQNASAVLHTSRGVPVWNYSVDPNNNFDLNCSAKTAGAVAASGVGATLEIKAGSGTEGKIETGTVTGTGGGKIRPLSLEDESITHQYYLPWQQQKNQYLVDGPALAKQFSSGYNPANIGFPMLNPNQQPHHHFHPSAFPVFASACGDHARTASSGPSASVIPATASSCSLESDFGDTGRFTASHFLPAGFFSPMTKRAGTAVTEMTTPPTETVVSPAQFKLSTSPTLNYLINSSTINPQRQQVAMFPSFSVPHSPLPSRTTTNEANAKMVAEGMDGQPLKHEFTVDPSVQQQHQWSMTTTTPSSIASTLPSPTTPPLAVTSASDPPLAPIVTENTTASTGAVGSGSVSLTGAHADSGEPPPYTQKYDFTIYKAIDDTAALSNGSSAIDMNNFLIASRETASGVDEPSSSQQWTLKPCQSSVATAPSVTQQFTLSQSKLLLQQQLQMINRDNNNNTWDAYGTRIEAGTLGSNGDAVNAQSVPASAACHLLSAGNRVTETFPASVSNPASPFSSPVTSEEQQMLNQAATGVTLSSMKAQQKTMRIPFPSTPSAQQNNNSHSSNSNKGHSGNVSFFFSSQPASNVDGVANNTVGMTEDCSSNSKQTNAQSCFSSDDNKNNNKPGDESLPPVATADPKGDI